MISGSVKEIDGRSRDRQSDRRWLLGSSLFIMILLLTLFLYASPSAVVESAPGDNERHQQAIGKNGIASIFRDCDVCPDMVALPSGSFLMGSPENERGRYGQEGPQHPVSVPSFALGRYEVTRGEFTHFVTETGHATGPCAYWISGFGNVRQDYDLDLHNPSHGHQQTARHPVTCVSFDDAKAYVDWLAKKTGRAYRLPSEAEWEYAARAGTTSRYFWGDEVGLACDHANGHDVVSQRTNGFNSAPLPCDDGYGMTAPVGSFGANAFSLFDMAGNLWEWVDDHYRKTYEGAPADGSPWLSPTGAARVLRGGSWEDEPRALRSAHRIWSRPGSRLNSNGFRVALTLAR